AFNVGDLGDPPQALVALLDGASRWQDADLVALADGAAGDLDGLGLVTFEVEAELAAGAEGAELSFECCSESRVLGACLSDEGGQAGHGVEDSLGVCLCCECRREHRRLSQAWAPVSLTIIYET